ncbi:MAG: 6-phosphogluconolactonase, partial [Gemmatimonadetes bacterium]|nr:6-phosphogluconolactonase [Gemmatimonadota bacterium]
MGGEREAWYADDVGDRAERRVLTLTLPVINGARCVLVMASGEDKARIVRKLADGGQDAADLPHLSRQVTDRIGGAAGRCFDLSDAGDGPLHRVLAGLGDGGAISFRRGLADRIDKTTPGVSARHQHHAGQQQGPGTLRQMVE